MPKIPPDDFTGKTAADAAGPEPFSQFMARALYHPQRGYYTARIRGVGRGGDFTTPAVASPLIGRSVAKWLRLTGKRFPKARHIIEIGGGDGSLMSATQQALAWRGRFGWRFHMVEISPILEKQQRARLGGRAAWHGSMEAALDACGGQALIYHHELLDAFPVTVLRKEENGGWSELCLQAGREVWLPWPGSATAEESSVFGAEAAGLPVGQRVEIAFSYREWLRRWAPHWRRGAMLTMDYGASLPELYHRRPQGTVRAYFHQRRMSGPEVWQNPGWQDITADVNFDDLKLWGRSLGITDTAQQSLAEFLRGHTAVRDRHAPVDQYLMNEEGAGAAFQVLEQERGNGET